MFLASTSDKGKRQKHNKLFRMSYDMKNVNAILISAFVCIASCKGRHNASNSQPINVDKGNVIREIPTYKNGPSKGDTTFLFQAIQKEAGQLNLSNLENGYDSLEIRVWLGHSMAAKRDVVVIQRKDNRWYGKLITFTLGSGFATLFMETHAD